MAAKILFLVHNLGRTRHFESVIRRLTRRRNTVVLAAARKRKLLRPSKTLPTDRVEVVTCPVHRLDRWEPFIEPLRRIGDHLRFFDPQVAHMWKIAERAESYTPAGWRAALKKYPSIRRHWRVVTRLLGVIERIVPADAYFEMYLRAEQPDVVLVTPLVDFSSYQGDYIKAAHRLGLPVAYLPFSWDNLTNRGRIHVQPDRVLVWNAHQQREAIDLHGVEPNRVVITGAPRFDDFMALTPTTSREDFCATVGLDPKRPFLLYVCSSRFVAPDEVTFVREWICGLRNSPHLPLQEVGVLVRPHPANEDQWTTESLAGIPGAALWQEKSEMNADPGLYHSLYHAHAVVGLNTSAMIEAAIVGRPVYAITRSEFGGGQSETFHFKYLLAEHGGPVVVATSLQEHYSQLAAPQSSSAIHERSARFVDSFVRPRGRKKSATDVMAEEIERLAAMPKSRRRTPFWHYPVRRALLTALEWSR